VRRETFIWVQFIFAALPVLFYFLLQSDRRSATAIKIEAKQRLLRDKSARLGELLALGKDELQALVDRAAAGSKAPEGDAAAAAVSVPAAATMTKQERQWRSRMKERELLEQAEQLRRERLELSRDDDGGDAGYTRNEGREAPLLSSAAAPPHHQQQHGNAMRSRMLDATTLSDAERAHVLASIESARHRHRQHEVDRAARRALLSPSSTPSPILLSDPSSNQQATRRAPLSSDDDEDGDANLLSPSNRAKPPRTSDYERFVTTQLASPELGGRSFSRVMVNDNPLDSL
jgi:hypothetical protein